MLPFVVLGLLCLAALMTLVLTSGGVQSMDAEVARWAAEEAPAPMTSAAQVLTHLADTPVYLSISAGVAVLLLVLHRRRLAGFVISVAVGQWLLSNLIKHAVQRERPDLDRLVDASGYSFPSGHATAAAALYLALALVIITVWPTANRIAVLVIGITIGMMVAATRVLVGVHWTTDVLAGLALGWTWCIVCAMAFGVVSTPSPRQAQPVAE